jgi:RNA polymerase sigma-70 factor (ECF subfamily)
VNDGVPPPVPLQDRPTRLTAPEADAVFRHILSDQTRPVFALVYAMTGDWHASQDITQETFIKLHGQLHKTEVDGRILAWTRRVAANAALNLIRARKAQPGPMDPLGADAEAECGVDPAVRQFCRDLLEHIAKLPSHKREIVEMRIWDRMSYGEISQEVGCSVDCAKKVFERFRKTLKRIES